MIEFIKRNLQKLKINKKVPTKKPRKEEDKKEIENTSYNNKKLSGSTIKVKVHRLINGTPIETEFFEARLTRDENNNTVILNDEKDMNFKEEMPGIQDTLVSDIIYKLKSRTMSKKKQLDYINKLIKEQDDIIKDEKNGYIIRKIKEFDKEKEKEIIVDKKVKINRQTEMSKLRIFKCSKYALENKDGNGFFESIDINGNRLLQYVIIDGELIPYWFRIPTDEGEPIILVPDVVGRKKFFKEAENEAIQDFNESVDWAMKGWLGLAMRALVVVAFAGLIIWTIFNARWSADLRDESLIPELDELRIDIEKTKFECAQQLAQQIENNGELLDYAKAKMTEEISNPKPINQNTDKSNIKI